MDLDYSRKGEIKFSMIKYLQKVEEKFPIEITGTAKSPACKHLFQVRDNDDPRKHYLDATRAMQFHIVTAQLLFASSRVRRDIQTTVLFLTSHVQKPDEDDWGKLVIGGSAQFLEKIKNQPKITKLAIIVELAV